MPIYKSLASRAALCAALCSLAALPAAALTEGVTDTTSVSFVFASTLETKLTLTESVSFPLLAGDGPLTEGNNLRLDIAGELSPVSVNGTFLATLTPVAFLSLSSGAGVGTGWNVPIADGLRMNAGKTAPDGTYTGERDLEDESFGGAVWYWKGGGTFQFDFAAIVPGEWNHAVVQTYQGFTYSAFTGASAGESWLWEADEGENLNGWSYTGNYFAGYRMPVGPDLVGLLVENRTRLYGTSGGDYWGESVPIWTWGPILNFGFRRDSRGNALTSLTLLAQWREMRTFTVNTSEADFYRYRRLVDGNPYRRAFYRAAVIFSHALR